MGGAHRDKSGNPFISALKSARWLITLIAIVAVPALIIYLLIFVATGLERWGALWLLELALLIAAFPRQRQDRTFLWIAAGSVLTIAWQFISTLAHQHRWPTGELPFIALTGNGIRLTAVACLVVGIMIGIRSGSLSWPWRPSAEE